MPLGIITDEQLNKEIGKVPPIIPEIIESNESPMRARVIDIKRGRGNILEVPESLRLMIAEDAINRNGSIKEIADGYGVSQSSVTAYKNDATSTTTYDKANESLAQSNKTVRDQITDKARGRLMSALDSITDENIQSAKVKDIASIAKDMSVIVKNLEPSEPQTQNNTQVIIYRPRMRDEQEFESITINE